MHSAVAMKSARQRTAFGHDVVMAALSFPLSLLIRVGSDIVNYGAIPVALGTAVFALAAATVFLSLRLYAGVWRYASVNDLMAITKAVTLAILIFLPALFLLNRLEWLPRSTIIIQWFVLMALLGGPRFVYRQFKDVRAERLAEAASSRRVPVLLVGAGDAAELFIRGIGRNPRSAYEAVGLVDEKGGRVGRNIHGVHVLGTIDDIPELLQRLSRAGKRPQRIILTKDTLEPHEMRRLIALADAESVSLARLPRLTDFRSGVSDGLEVRPVAIEDVLGRAQRVLDRASMKALIDGRRVLVTGAGGTIGAELARQVAEFGPASLALVDSSEFALYSVDLEIRERHPALGAVATIADVRDEGRVRRLFQAVRPEIVFHAAALKHVPIVEAHPAEGVLTNVHGTRVIADACRAAGAHAMVLISTDKAVNPTSVMGATKRIAETYCQALDLIDPAGPGRPRGTRFITVRFGNVLGSTGSVVPLFQRQLAHGGPLTVTHPDMRRYFMTVREAVELVLEATVLGTRGAASHGKIYALDMGEPVKIVDLARQMIVLAGLRPDIDIKIAFSGPRPGEKLYEEVLHDGEPPQPTAYDGILLAAPRIAEYQPLVRAIDALAAAARAGNDTEILALIRHFVPEYQPAAGAGMKAAISQG